MTKKKVHKLDFTPDYNFTMFGIISDEKDYKLIWDINNMTGWALERVDNYLLYNRKTQNENEFPLFLYQNNDGFSIFRLISNKFNGNILLEELRNIDFLLIIHDLSGNMDLSLISSKLKKVKAIRALFPFDSARLKDREKLLF